MLSALSALIRRFGRHKHKPKGDFVLRRRYELTLTSLTSQKRLLDMRMRKGSFIAMCIALFVLIGAIWIAAVIYTPLRNTLPMRLQTDLRDEYVELSVRLDSATNAATITDAYVQNIIAILRDSVDNAEPQPQTQPLDIPLDSLMEASDAERTFVNRFEAQERYNLSVLSPIAAEGMIFTPPTSGTQAEERVSESGIPYVVLSGANILPVSAVYRGTVTNAYYTTGKGITLVIQHPNDFMTVYSGLAEIFVTKGDKVKAGQRIGIAQHDKYPLTFELWHNGAPLPPKQYIDL